VPEPAARLVLTLDATIDGDRQLAELVLAGIGAFARD
jgi:hypothetical protein